MDATEILDWWAFDMLNDKEFRARMIEELALQEQQTQTVEDEAKRIIEMFSKLGMKNSPLGN